MGCGLRDFGFGIGGGADPDAEEGEEGGEVGEGEDEKGVLERGG